MISNINKIAVVFGVRNDSSIAFHTALKLHESGCKVVLSYAQECREEVVFLMEKYQLDSSYAMAVDIRDEQQISTFLKQVFEGLGAIDYILHAVAYGNQNVMCYGLAKSDVPAPSYIDIPFEDLMDSFNISAYSLLRICRVAEPLFSPHASVLTLTYNAAQRVFPGYAGMSVNKAALENIMKYLASYFRKDGVRLNAISAGLVMTTSAAGISGVRSLRKLGKFTAPLGNINASDVADTALYYFSDLSKSVTGNIHYVDGGFNIMGVSVDE